MKTPQIIIPMSGIGKRFIDAGYTSPKPLIVVDDLPMIEHVINLFNKPESPIFVCNEKHIRENDLIGKLKKISPKCLIYEVPNENRKGPVDAIRQIFDRIDDENEVIVSYCDYGTKWNYENFLIDVRNRKVDGAIVCYTGFHPHMLGCDNYAFCKMDGQFVSEIKEKDPFTDNKMNEYASNGTYYFKSGKILKKYFQELIDNNINVNGEFYVSLVYNLLIKDGLKVSVFEIEKMLQWGTPYDLEIYKSWSNYFKNKKNKLPPISCPPNTTLILPMAGKGSRFSEYGYNLPKPFLPLDNSIMVIEAVKCLPLTNKKNFVCLSNHCKEYDFKEVLLGHFEQVSITEIDEVTDGQAITCEIGLLTNEINLEDPILISACDNGILYNSIELQKYFEDESVDVIVWSFRNNQSSKNSPNSYAWLEVDENDNIQFVSCKKFIYDDPLKTHAIVGTMFFRKAKFFIDGLFENKKNNIRTNNEFYVDDILNQNIKNGLRIKNFEVENYICWGTPDDYKTYNYWKDYFEEN